MKGVLLDKASLDRADLDFAKLHAALEGWQMFDDVQGKDISEAIANAEVVVSNKVELDASVLDKLPKLELICVAATGTNNIDMDAAQRHGIQVCNVRDYASSSVAQHTFMLILSLLRHLPDYMQAVNSGLWQQSRHFCLLDYPIGELDGMTLGIVGYGKLGQKVAQLAGAFGMQVVIARRDKNDTRTGRIPLDEVLARSDVLSLHCPLTDETRNLISSNQLALMKPSAILINTARGGIVDEAALATALCRGKLAGAGSDVLVNEPPDGKSPLMDPAVPNMIVTPHIAWASRKSRQRLLDQVAENITSYRLGALNNRLV